MSFNEVMNNVTQSDVMDADAFNSLWNIILNTWSNIYTMLTSVKVAGIPLFLWFVTFAAISVLLVVVSNLSLGDASISSVLGFGKSETQKSHNQHYKDKNHKGG